MHNPQDVQIGQRLIALGMLQQAQAYHCLQTATNQRRSFLTVAVELRYLTMAQANALHNQQGSMASTVSGSQHLRSAERKTAPLDREHLQQQIQGSNSQQDAMRSAQVNDSQVPFRTNSTPQTPALPLPQDSNPASSTFHPRARPTQSTFSGEGMLPAPGDLIDGYEIKSLLGRGGMGAVFLAEKSESFYAIKVITTADASALTRFEREAQAAARVDSHPNIVSIHSYSKRLEVPYIVMDFVEGKGLDTLMDDPDMTIHRSLEIVAIVAEALDFVHHRGIVHRDLKPANILIRESDQQPLVTDFGIAKQFDEEALTRSTDVLGTPHYMSPEQAGSENDQIDESSDVWAMGVILYELVFKAKPFEGQTMLQIARNIMFAPVTIPDDREKSIPHDLVTVLLKALAKDKEDRYFDAETFAKDCRAVANSDPISATRLTWFQQKKRKLQRRSPVSLLIWSLVLLFLFASPGAAYYYSSGRQSSDEISARIEKHARPYSEKIREYNLISTKALAQKLVLVLKRSNAAPVWDPIVKDMSEDYQRLANLRSVAYERGYELAFNLHIDPKKWARIQGTQAVIDAFEIEDQKALTARFPKIRSRDAKLASAIVALRSGSIDESTKLFADLESKSGNTGRIARFALALIALEKNDFEDGLGRLEQLRDVEGFSETAVEVLLREWPKAFVYTAFARDEGSLHSNLSTQFKQMKDFAKTVQDSKLFWEQVNEQINAQFLKEGTQKDRRRRIARVFEALKAKSLVASEIKCPRLTSALHLALAQRIEARYDERSPAELRKALFHHLSIQKFDEAYQLPSRYKKVLSGLAMGSMMESPRDAYNDVLVVSRAGVYLSYIRTFVLDQFERNNVLDAPVAQNPADFAARFWRGNLASLNKSQRRRLGDARVKSRILRALADLDFVLGNPNTPQIFRALAFHRRADWRIERALIDRTDQVPVLDRALFDAVVKDCQSAIENSHPEPDRVYELLMRLESRYKGMKGSVVTASPELQLKYADLWVESVKERERRTQMKTLGRGRPKQCPMAVMVGYRNKLRSAYTSLSRAYQNVSKYREAADAAQSAINCALSSDEKRQMFDALYELVESLLVLKEVAKAEKAYLDYCVNPRFRSQYSKKEIAYLEELWRSSKRRVPGKKP